MKNAAEMVEHLIKKRKEIPQNQLAEVCKLLLLLSIKDEKAAKIFVKHPHRFLQNANKLAPEETAQFLKKYASNNGILQKFIKHAGILQQLAGRAANINLNYQGKCLQKQINAYKKSLNDIFDGRTLLMAKHNPNVALEDKRPVVDVNGQEVPCVTRYTRNFNQKLASVGASNSREIILLNPDSQTLEDTYLKLKSAVKKQKNIAMKLQVLNKITQKVFPNSKLNTNYDGKFISLGQFIRDNAGVCRHHTLLNCYLLSRLKEDGLIPKDSEIIHHRQNVKQGAHTWVILKTNSQRFSLDSLNNDCFNVSFR